MVSHVMSVFKARKPSVQNKTLILTEMKYMTQERKAVA